MPDLASSTGSAAVNLLIEDQARADTRTDGESTGEPAPAPAPVVVPAKSSKRRKNRTPRL